MEWRELEFKKKKMGKLMTTRCFSPFLGNVSPCKSKWVGGDLCTVLMRWMVRGFFEGCVSTTGYEREWMCVVWEYRAAWELQAAKDRILQSNCTIAMSGWGGGRFWLFVRESLPTTFLLFLLWKGVINNTHLGGKEWMVGQSTTQGSYWWHHHHWASGHSTHPMF